MPKNIKYKTNIALDKYFILDKNYLLKTSQKRLKEELTKHFWKQFSQFYFEYYNPLKIMDALSEKVLNFDLSKNEYLDIFYSKICAIYRYKENGANQLELLFDKPNQLDFFKNKREIEYKNMITVLFKNIKFIHSILNHSVLNQTQSVNSSSLNHLNNCLNTDFNVKIRYARKKFKIA